MLNTRDELLSHVDVMAEQLAAKDRQVTRLLDHIERQANRSATKDRRIQELETALAALCQVCDGPLDNPAWPGVLASAKGVLGPIGEGGHA